MAEPNEVSFKGPVFNIYREVLNVDLERMQALTARAAEVGITARLHIESGKLPLRLTVVAPSTFRRVLGTSGISLTKEQATKLGGQIYSGLSNAHSELGPFALFPHLIDRKGKEGRYLLRLATTAVRGEARSVINTCATHLKTPAGVKLWRGKHGVDFMNSRSRIALVRLVGLLQSEPELVPLFMLGKIKVDDAPSMDETTTEEQP